MTRTTPRSNGKAARHLPASIRVAIYARQSVADHEKEFGSVQAQIEAAQAFITSQRGAGWILLPEPYQDHGYSGSTTQRPAFQRLLTDIHAGRVDAVVVYRTDRLSRSLLDFTKLMSLFETRGVAFASVTEHFDTSTPMGRMVVNLLATFAQFERESIAARTKDKMLATRKRGAWTGGRPALGYDIIEKKLVVSEAEAKQVRSIYQAYLEHGGLLAVVEEPRDRGWRTKGWTNAKGERAGGEPFTKGTLHSLLRNVLYVGKIHAGDEVVNGAHEAIVALELWQSVQDQVRTNGREGARPRQSRGSALLAGIARCVCGAAMTPTFTVRGARRYSYYVCGRINKEGAASCPGSRVGAGEFEAFVFEQMRQIGSDPRVLEATLEADRRDRDARKPELLAEARRLTTERTRIETERSNVVEAIAKGGAGAHVLVQKLAELDEEFAGAEQRLSAARAEVQALDLRQADPEELRAALSDLTDIWSELFVPERRRVFALLLEQVVFDAAAGEVSISFRPDGPRRVRRKETAK